MMNKPKTWLVLLFSLLSSGVVNATNKQTKLEYKCHFELIGGGELIQHVVSKSTKATTVAAQMKGSHVYGKNGKTKLKINRVVECVKVKEQFKSIKSQQLDKITLS